MSMKKFNKATLAMAVAGALAASSAQAVNLAEDGLGDFIISPYYTVRDGFQTYINVTNTSEETVVFKIRFREHYNSRDARDFNVILSPYDVWTAAVILNEDGDAARLVTHDRTCTAPISIRNSGIDFTNFMWAGANEDGGPTGLERTMEGYFEIINMGHDAEQTGVDNDTDIAYNAKHVNGEPRDCNAVEQEFVNGGIGDFALFDEPENALKVSVAILNVNDGLGFAVNPTVLANFYNPDPVVNPQDQASDLNLVRAPSKSTPNVTDVTPRTSTIQTNTVGVTINSDWSLPADESAADPVTALLMRNNIINQFRVEDGQADTDWVITLPTKNYHVDPMEVGLVVRDPFVEIFDGEGDDVAAGSCFQVMYNFWDREEETVDDPGQITPSPEVPGADPNELCREVNVIEFGQGVLSSFEPTNLDETRPFDMGWLRIDLGPFDGDLAKGGDSAVEGEYDLSDDLGVRYEGLPVIGFAIQNLDNWSVGNELVQYGFAIDHAYGRSVWSVGGIQMGNNPAEGDDLSYPTSL